ncbi:nucleolar complex protein 4, putative [Plasmodium vivax]|nr:nucleolar complex protein 4, putative [Plasmodium vivax]
MRKAAAENNPSASAASDICALFTALQSAKSKKAILTSLTKLFLLLYNERMKRKLLYGSIEETRCSGDEEDNASLRRIFKNDLIILEGEKKEYTKYEHWLNECYGKFLNMLFELLSHSDEVLVTKSLSLLFGSLQFEAKIYDKIASEKEVQSSLKKAFPIKLFRKIIFELLKIDQISISTIKYICKVYLCFYYDLNYFFLSILKSFCILRKGLRDEKFYGDGGAGSQGGRNGECAPEDKASRGDKDMLRDNPNTNLLIFSILINSIKPEKKIKDTHIRRKDYLKRGRIDELFFNLYDEELKGFAKRKRRRISRRKEEEKMPYDKAEMKKTFHDCDTDDSIVHSSGEESDGASSPEGDSSTGESDTAHGGNFLRNANLMHHANFSDEDFDVDQVEDYIISPKRKKKIKVKLKNRKQNLFISENVDKRIYAILYASCWFYFITSFNHSHSMVLQLLHSIPLFVFPYTNNPFYLIDFFNYSFYSSPGLYTSLAALPGMFHILTELNVGDLLQGGGEAAKLEGTDRFSGEGRSDVGRSEEGRSEQGGSEQGGSDVEGEENGKGEEPSEQGTTPQQNRPEEGANKLNDNMYTDYYKRLFELITPASFYYADTSFLKIIHASIKNQMIPLHYVISFLKKLLRVACLTSYNVSINILSVVYDSMSYFQSELKDAMSLSASVFLNLEIKKDLFCYEDLGKNFEKKKIVQMLGGNSKALRGGGGNADGSVDGSEDDNEEGKNPDDHQIAAPNGQDTPLCAELPLTEKDITPLQTTAATPQLSSTKKLFSLQECLPNKYQINVNNLKKKELYMANHIFYEIILLNNHLCENLKQYSNVYHYSFGSDSFAKPQTFYTNPSKFNLQMESSLFGLLKNFLSFKKRREADILPSVERKAFSTVFL